MCVHNATVQYFAHSVHNQCSVYDGSNQLSVARGEQSAMLVVYNEGNGKI
jgi:hypothetical protein